MLRSSHLICYFSFTTNVMPTGRSKFEILGMFELTKKLKKPLSEKTLSSFSMEEKNFCYTLFKERTYILVQSKSFFQSERLASSRKKFRFYLIRLIVI